MTPLRFTTGALMDCSTAPCHEPRLHVIRTSAYHIAQVTSVLAIACTHMGRASPCGCTRAFRPPEHAHSVARAQRQNEHRGVYGGGGPGRSAVLGGLGLFPRFCRGYAEIERIQDAPEIHVSSPKNRKT